MKLTLSKLPILLLLTAFACSNQTSTAQPPANKPASSAVAWSLYQQYCINCHGNQMQGGSGSNLIDDEWKHGSTPEAIYSSISAGIPNLGMPGYSETLTKDQMVLLVQLIQNKTVPEIPEDKIQPKNSTSITTLDYEVFVEEWLGGMKSPWGLEFIDENTALLTEKEGGLRAITNIRTGAQLGPRVTGTPKVESAGQGGMLGLAIDPEFAQNGWIYLSYSHNLPAEPDKAMTRIVRGRVIENSWRDEQTLWEAPAKHYTPARHHYGCRIVFAPDGTLFFAIGDRGNQKRAQDITDPAGKVHRINRDGSIPKDNPFLNTPGAFPSAYTIGNRNIQGMSFHPVLGTLWTLEHGPRGGDELNLIQPGLNYGWPEITYGINYNGSVITKERVRPGLEQPIWYWRPSLGICAADFYTGGEFPFWKNKLLATSLANQTLRLLTIQDNRMIHEEIILSGRGRIRDVTSAPDGAIYVVLNGPDQILRLTAVEEKLQ